MDRIVPISEARANLGELVEEARDHEVYLVKHGHPVGVLLSVEAYEAALERIEDLEDTIAVLRAGDAVPFERSDSLEARTPDPVRHLVHGRRGEHTNLREL